ncbi:MAG: hypothetical protein K2H03_04305, partial [Muribaculaceae bacterium]|nr:hypothetical protein [Muribaculaceae bacterium]
MRTALLAIAISGAFTALGAGPLDEAAKAISQYRLDEASDILDNWETKANRTKKTRLTADQNEALEDMRSRIMTMRNMLDRVEQIEVIDSMTVDADDFFL